MVNKQEFLDTYSYFDKDLLTEIIDIFLNEYKGRIDKLHTDVQSADFESLRFDAHSVKGVIATFCAPLLKEKAYELEVLARNLVETKGDGFDVNEFSAKVEELGHGLEIMAVELTEVKESF